MAKTLQLDQGWFWKQRNKELSSVLEEVESPSRGDIEEGWRTAHAFPSEVHVELLKEGLIPDPYVGFNEHQVQ
ncbi:hypothetical protein C0992_013000, partial [Termitomyces sp. T32_za158]